jgi:hypothetical protein
MYTKTIVGSAWTQEEESQDACRAKVPDGYLDTGFFLIPVLFPVLPLPTIPQAPHLSSHSAPSLVWPDLAPNACCFTSVQGSTDRSCADVWFVARSSSGQVRGGGEGAGF